MKMFVPLYHGVIEDSVYEKDSFEQIFQKHLPCTEFEKQVKWLVANFEMLNVEEFYQKCVLETPQNNYSLLTFDDVYANFKTNAIPILEKYNCPVTIFPCTGFALSVRSSWTDEIERVLMNVNTSTVKINGRLFRTENTAYRIQSVLDVKTYIKSLPAKKLHMLMDELLRQYDNGITLPKARMMSLDEVFLLRKHHLVSLCHHSHSHNVLLNESTEDICKDITENIRIIGPARFFAYPFGERDVHFDERVKQLIRKKGFLAAFSVQKMPTYNDFDLYEIPRKEMHINDHLNII